MARLNNPRPSTEVSLWPNRATPATESRNPSSSPAASFGSDKENRTARPQVDKTTGKRPMEPPRSTNANNQRANKRRRVTGDGQSPARHRETNHNEGRAGSKWFDPDQNPEERRDVRIGSRKLQRDWNEQKADLLSPAVPFSKIRDIVSAHERHFKHVKQTADALDDSRQMIEIADLVHAKTKQLGNGVSELNINLEDFIDKWVYYGIHGRAQGTEEDDSVPTSTQRQRRRNQTQRANANDDDDDEAEELANELNWELLGEQVCFPSNNRPPVPSFLLGPLAVQKKVRSTQRQGRQRREPLAAVTKPQDIRAEDLERNEATNLTSQCRAIRDQLAATSASCQAAFDEDPEKPEDLGDPEANNIARKHGLAPNWEVPLLRFAINPHSFSQTVENFFYISFVIRDGFFLVSKDEDGLPTIRPNQGSASESDRATGTSRHQAIFSIDYEMWQKLIVAYDITESMIPHREEENIGVPNAHGWYG
ncbi:hypothetical protein EG328_002282 [Venturia inaequalis]|uniref:Non-structural maintenance of chromosomes element 4 n=1 Tax=Venturia inaequalis TaxID=5025 RepID=A0A8H3UUX9_VENIN|nr:hypothetical protein EG328_002282 [Venturia inaequalis]KAE9992862.1 hypothetical protein EG327_007489 [Venturia inaequalis]